MKEATASIQIQSIALAEQCKLGVVLTMADGFKGCFFCDDVEDSGGLTRRVVLFVLEFVTLQNHNPEASVYREVHPSKLLVGFTAEVNNRLAFKYYT